MDYPSQPGPLKRFWDFISAPDYRRTVSVLSILLLTAIIPLTAYFAGQQQDVRQRAAGGCPTHTDGSPAPCMWFSPDPGTVGRLLEIFVASDIADQTPVLQPGTHNPVRSGTGGSCGHTEYDNCWVFQITPGVDGFHEFTFYSRPDGEARVAKGVTVNPGPTITPSPTPARPGNITGASATASCTPSQPTMQTIRAQWDAYSGAVSYRVALSHSTMSVNPAQCITGTSHTFNPVAIPANPALSYQFTVSAYPQANCSGSLIATGSDGDVTTATNCQGPAVTNTPTPTPSRTPTPSPTNAPGVPTATPTPTNIPGVPTNTPTPTPTPTPVPGGVQIAVKLKLQGIGGTAENTDPQRPSRDVTLQMFNDNNVKVAEKTGQITYNAQTGTFTGTVDMGVVANGSYLVKAKMTGYLTKLIQSILPITGPDIYEHTGVLKVIGGDMTGNNVLDVLDYNQFVPCFGNRANTSSCTNKTTADINDDGNVDGIDYQLFVKSLSVRQGD